MWTLITVTNGGQVNESRHATQASCEQAKSIALTGMTIEENQKADEEYATSLRAEEARWESLPWRDPKEKWEIDAVKANSSGGGSGGFYFETKDGKIRSGQRYDRGGFGISYDPNNGESVEYVRGRPVLRHKTDIKYAECVPPES